ncbi:RNA polymerase recycling motor HelD [Numidum massiliense]|uniref:RNA polymerase recycling motor HelD n=1 Tax=Numidum massiliense TaxID=1522315 RepID=UPI00093B86B0|nr:RNA polymerase recycling motor HelD [Numidum massiliense]
MNLTDKDWQKEQQRVDRVVADIDARITSLEQQTDQAKTEIVDIRKHFWDDVTVNLDDAIEAIETFTSIRQQAEVLSERERSHGQAHKQLTTMRRLKQSPYFGRIDFVAHDAAIRSATDAATAHVPTEVADEAHENTAIHPDQSLGDPSQKDSSPAETALHIRSTAAKSQVEAEQIYLGTASFYDEDSEQFLVYDWRAPVSSLYYDYSPGPVQYETPSGTVSGNMTLKRQYIIRDGRIASMFDTSVTIGDELLQEVLGKQSDTQMKSIVATIQKEQNHIIRNEKSRLFIVQGAAGSGKTSAALQRVAYLLYRYRETLKAEQIVLFSPNDMFNSYVSSVLPELGEENMQQTTFQQYLQYRLGSDYKLEDPFTQLEYVLTAMDEPGYAERVAGIRFKASIDFMDTIEKYIAWLGQDGMIFRDITFRGKILISAAYMKKQFYALDASISLPNRIQLLVEKLLKKLQRREWMERDEQWVEEAIELLDEETYMRAYHELQRKRKKRRTTDTFDDYEQEKKLLASWVVAKQFKPLRAHVRKLRFINMHAIYRQLFAGFAHPASDSPLPPNWATICAQTVAKLDRNELAAEDATPYLYLHERITGFQTNTTVRHVFVDEAQDYSPFQFAFIKRLFPRSKMTVLGDLNQAIYAHAAGSGYALLSSLFGSEQTETVLLTRSYRSTRPIVEFTRGMIAGGETIEPFNRAGNLPTVTRVADKDDRVAKIAARIRTLQQDGLETIAVICKTARESREAYTALQENGSVPVRLIARETASFEAGTVIIPAYLAKGVEFDAVIVYDASETQYGRENERKLLYTACTRAMHELHLYYVGEVSPFIASLSPDTYVADTLVTKPSASDLPAHIRKAALKLSRNEPRDERQNGECI